MGHVSGTAAALMELRIVALYPGRIAALGGLPGVRFRSRRKAQCTLVPCRVEALDGRSIGTPEYPVPEGTPNPVYRAQFQTFRMPVEQRRILCVVLSAEPDCWRMDPEQVLLSPIFDDGHRMIFEFRRAHILSISRHGEIETRFVAVDPVRGVIGTKTIHRFDTKLLALAARCVDHLSGIVDMFPMREGVPLGQRIPIPVGEANLSFPPGKPPRFQPDAGKPPRTWVEAPDEAAARVTATAEGL